MTIDSSLYCCVWLKNALADYDALGLSAWQFSPLTPIVRCPL